MGVRLPSEINILGDIFRIIQTSDIKKLTLDDGTLCAANIDLEDQIIYLEKKLNKKQKIIALAHEVGHGICRITGLSEWLSNHEEEMICQSFASGYYLSLLKRAYKIEGR